MALSNSQYEAIIKEYERTRYANYILTENRREEVYRTIPGFHVRRLQNGVNHHPGSTDRKGWRNSPSQSYPECETGHREKSKELLYDLCEDLYGCDLLIIDDLGTELTNQFVASQLFSLLNERHMGKKVEIFDKITAGVHCIPKTG